MEQRTHDTTIAGAAGAPDLVRMALDLMGCQHVDDVLGRALDLLGEIEPGSAWALLHRLGPRQYHATVRGAVAHQDLRQIAEETCGRQTWLSLSRVVRLEGVLPTPPRVAVHSAPDGGPDLVLARWDVDDAPSTVGTAPLDLVARLIGSAVASARLFEAMLERSTRDALTSLLNRRGILEVLGRERARARRTGGPIAVLFLDLDGFKSINDDGGHAVGDEVLSAVAVRLSRALRASDLIGRLGGDEFLVVLPDTELATARRVGRRLARSVATPAVTTSAGPFAVGLTCGAASLDEALGVEGLIELADRRMLARKRRGRSAPPAGRPEAARVGGAAP